MRAILRGTFLIALALAVPVLPLLFLGLSFEEQVETWLKVDVSPTLRFALIAAVLASDLLLPIPSSAVSTYGGGILGTWPATASSWLGMTLGACLGFGLARAFGRQYAARWSDRGDLDRMELVTHRFGPLALFLTRPLPILAEACVLFLGASRLSWRRFLIPVMAANFAVSLAYAACGEYFKGRNALPAAVVASAVLPLGLALATRHWLTGLNRTSVDREINES